MKYFLLLFIFTIINCKQQSNSSPETTSPPDTEPTKPTEPKLYSIWDYTGEEGIAHVLERKLEGYELKAAIVNSFHSLLFYYNEDLQQVCCYVEDGLTSEDKENAILQINGKDMRPNIRYFINEHDSSGELFPVDLATISEKELNDIQQEATYLAYGFKLGLTDTFHFSVKFIGQGMNQKAEITYDPNNGWRSLASSITFEEEPITANIFAFGKMNIIDQLKNLPENDKKCVLKTQALPQYGRTLKIDLDNHYGKSGKYKYEIEVRKKAAFINDKKIEISEIKNLIDEETKLPSFPPEIRISLSNTSDEQTVRELFIYFQYRISQNCSVGIK